MTDHTSTPDVSEQSRVDVAPAASGDATGTVLPSGLVTPTPTATPHQHQIGGGVASRPSPTSHLDDPKPYSLRWKLPLGSDINAGSEGPAAR